MTRRIETDSLGQVELPADALYGAQTQRAVHNFSFSGRAMPADFIRYLAVIKIACARANVALGSLDRDRGQAIEAAALRIAGGEFAGEFPVDVFQTGSGTSTNMNMNEVIVGIHGRDSVPRLHPNDHVNCSQSSNDVIPSCLQVSAAEAVRGRLLPALDHLQVTLGERAGELADVIKTGRTHLMDATPITLGQEMATWQAQVVEAAARLADGLPRLWALPLGGTAVGTGINAPAGFAAMAIGELNQLTGNDYTPAADRGSRMAAQDVALECSAALRGIAVVLLKICNDLRWMASGPLSGLGEIQLKALQPGSSIMPGKVNPVIPEAVAMIAAEIHGNDASIAMAAQSGNFQLNVMLPLIADKLLGGIELLARGCEGLSGTLHGVSANAEHLAGLVARNPMLVTALNQRVGYDLAARIAREAYAQGRPVIEVAAELTDLSAAELDKLLDPRGLVNQPR